MIYLDNAATTHKKPECVYLAVNAALRNAANPGRSGHRLALQAAETVYAARESVAQLFNVGDASRIIFTQNATAALNMAVKGILWKYYNPHVVITGMEHNSVLRPVHATSRYSIAAPNQYGEVTLEAVKKSTRADTRLIAMTHASNVTGTLNDISSIGAFARARGIPFLVDAAQTAGVIPIDVERDNIDMLAFAGHKGLYGPSGTGGLYVCDGINLLNLMEGGTGSTSESYEQPDFLPDKYESGTVNHVGIAGLGAGVEYILSNSNKGMFELEKEIIIMLVNGISAIDGVKIYGTMDIGKRVGVVGFNVHSRGSVDVASILDTRYSIATRAGMHCSVLAHRSMGTHASGMVRASISCFTSRAEVEAFLEALRQIART